MPKKLFKQWLPDPEVMKSNPALKFLGFLFEDPNLFHLNRRSVSLAFFVGLFIAFLPILGQVPLAAFLAFIIRCNLPITISLIWISNPITLPFIIVATYKLGSALLQLPPRSLNFELTWQWFTTDFAAYWQPILLGSVIASIFFGTLGYISIQMLWRWHVVKRWQNRNKK